MHAAQYRVLLHRPVAVREELLHMSSWYIQKTLPDQQAVLPPIYCSYLPSFLCFSIVSLRLQSMRILTSSHGTDRTTDVIHMGLTATEWGWLTARLFVENCCLELLIIDSAYNSGWTAVLQRELLTEIRYMHKLTSRSVLLRSTFSEMFCLWYNSFRSSQDTLHSCTLSTDFSTSIARTRTNNCMTVRLKSRHD
jgi:hypothetical protein